MTNAEKAALFTIQLEGGFQLSADVNGARVYAGINEFWHKNSPLWKYPESELHVKPRNAIVELVLNIYRIDYWEPLRCDSYAFETAFLLFDFGVNEGLQTAIRAAQVVAFAPYHLGMVDGVMGHMTEAKLSHERGIDFCIKYSWERAKSYGDIVHKNPARANELPGWLHRIERAFYHVEGMAQKPAPPPQRGDCD